MPLCNNGSFRCVLVTRLFTIIKRLISTAIFHESRDNNWRIVVRLYRGPMLLALFLFFMGLNVQVFDLIQDKSVTI